MYLKECDHTSSTVLLVLLTAFTPLVMSCPWTLIRSLLTNEERFPNKIACRLSTPSRSTSISSAFQFSFFAFVDILKVCKLSYTAIIRQHMIWHMIFCGPVLRHGKNTTSFVKHNFFIVRTICDVLMKLTYALLRKQRTHNLRYIVRTLLMKLAPEQPSKISKTGHSGVLWS